VEVIKTLEERRSYRALEKIAITEDMVHSLAESAQLAPSCFNNQPWRYVFVTGAEQLNALWVAYAPGNEWCREASLVIAVFTKKELDCVIKGREYDLFDTGIATGMMMLRATELGLVTHGIAGFDEPKVKDILSIPADMQVIALIIVGKKASLIPESFTPQQRESELHRPPRNAVELFAFRDRCTDL
jgi:nitroreductase